MWARWASGMPALLTRMSTRPSDSLAWATAWVIDSASVTSRAIGTHSPPLACDLLGQLLELVDAPGGGGDLGAGGGQRQGEAPPEPGAGAGHEGDAAGEVVGHVGQGVRLAHRARACHLGRAGPQLYARPSCGSGCSRREYPPEVYGGAGVHVDFLTRELARLVDVEVHCIGAPRPGAIAHSEDDPRLVGANPVLRIFAADLEMAAGVGDVRPRPLPHVVRQPRRAPRQAALRHPARRRRRTRSSRQRPWKAEQLGGGYALSSWAERTAYEAADAVIAVSAASQRRRPRRLPGARPGTRPRRAQRHRHRAVPAGARDRRAGRASASTSTGRSSPSSGGSPARRACRTCCVPRSAFDAGAPRSLLLAGAADTPELAAETDAAVAALRRRARRRRARHRGAAARRRPPGAQPLDGVRVPVDLRAARHRQPRGDGVRHRRRGQRRRRHPRGRRRRRDRAARPLRRRRRRRPSRPPSPPPSTDLVADPALRRARWAPPVGERATREFGWDAAAAPDPGHLRITRERSMKLATIRLDGGNRAVRIDGDAATVLDRRRRRRAARRPRLAGERRRRRPARRCPSPTSTTRRSCPRRTRSSASGSTIAATKGSTCASRAACSASTSRASVRTPCRRMAPVARLPIARCSPSAPPAGPRWRRGVGRSRVDGVSEA